MSTKRKLNIGGIQAVPGWEIFNITEASYVDHIGDARDLSRFADDTFSAIYASHVLEHFDYKDEMLKVLKEWKRVLHPGGKLYLSTPDLDILATLFLLKDKLSLQERFQVMRIIFGGHMDKHDYHFTGLNQEILELFLKEAEYLDIKRVENFGIFQDTSTMLFKGIPISLNLIATKP